MNAEHRQSEPAGLCVSCTQVADCSLRSAGANAYRAAWSCAEFDGGGRAATAPLLRFEQGDPGLLYARPSDLAPRVSGLCGDCSHLGRCALRDGRQPVWHCEEYS